mmetsp:Transcript_8789/g.21383  ORF Transcript_8789/g.21383 Transcript_8789/m.21383 type:complete len:237 (+) Transcript_8789:987-1697(+)
MLSAVKLPPTAADEDEVPSKWLNMSCWLISGGMKAAAPAAAPSPSPAMSFVFSKFIASKFNWHTPRMKTRFRSACRFFFASVSSASSFDNVSLCCSRFSLHKFASAMICSFCVRKACSFFTCSCSTRACKCESCQRRQASTSSLFSRNLIESPLLMRPSLLIFLNIRQRRKTRPRKETLSFVLWRLFCSASSLEMNFFCFSTSLIKLLWDCRRVSICIPFSAICWLKHARVSSSFV